MKLSESRREISDVDSKIPLKSERNNLKTVNNFMLRKFPWSTAYTCIGLNAVKKKKKKIHKSETVSYKVSRVFTLVIPI